MNRIGRIVDEARAFSTSVGPVTVTTTEQSRAFEVGQVIAVCNGGTPYRTAKVLKLTSKFVMTDDDRDKVYEKLTEDQIVAMIKAIRRVK